MVHLGCLSIGINIVEVLSSLHIDFVIIEFKEKLGFWVYSKFVRGLMLLHFVNTNEGNKVQSTLKSFSICVCSSSAVTLINTRWSDRRLLPNQTDGISAAGSVKVTGDGSSTDCQTGASTPARLEASITTP